MTNHFFENTNVKEPRSYWIQSTPTTDFPKLSDRLKVDVAIIGGGLVGMSTALLLKQAGVKVCVLEARKIGQRTTSHSTAKITSQHSLIYDTLINNFGKEKAKQYADANQAAVEKMVSITKEYNIDCDLSRQNAYVYTQSEKELKNIEKEVEAAQSLGLPASFTTRDILPFPIKGAVCFTNQAQFHPRKYILGLKNILEKDVPIFENTRVLDVEEGTPHKLITEKGEVLADQIVVSTHYPFINRHGFYYIKMYTSRSYVIGLYADHPQVEGMSISAGNTVRSFRTQPTDKGEMVILAGAGHRTGKAQSTLEHYNTLEQYAHTIYDNPTIAYRWSTQDCITLDQVPYIGHYSSNTHTMYVATGFKKWGISSSTVSAMILSDKILGRQNPWADVFDPSRFIPKASAKELVKQGVDVTANYLALAFTLPSEHLDDLQAGHGKIIDHKNQKIGIYKDENNQIHAVYPVCTHMKCQLSWNDAEKSWDCTCHGSRFTYSGEVIEGPTVKPLERIKIQFDK